MDLVDKIIAYEYGELSDSETISMFQELIDKNQVSCLPGQSSQIAQALIDEGSCTARG